MQHTDEQIRDLLDYDSLHEAEKIAGDSWHDNSIVAGLGLDLHMRSVAAKEHVLRQIGDTVFSMKTPDYIEVIETAGFKKVLQEDILYVYWRDPGQLLVFDNYEGHRNAGHVYYNWLPNDLSYCRLYTSSGGWHLSERAAAVHDAIYRNTGYGESHEKWAAIYPELRDARELAWVGDHDCREALLFNLRQLAEHGTFLEPWIECPRLWLCHWKDTHKPAGSHSTREDFDRYDRSRKDRLARFPEEIRRKMGLC